MSKETIAWLAEICPLAISPQVAAEAQRQLEAEQAARERRQQKPQRKPQRKQGFLELSQGQDE